MDKIDAINIPSTSSTANCGLNRVKKQSSVKSQVLQLNQASCSSSNNVENVESNQNLTKMVYINSTLSAKV